MEAQCRLIAQNRNMKDEEKTNNTKVNDMKRDARINQRATSLTKLVTNIPNDMMVSEDNSTPLLQVLISLSTDIIKDSYHHIGGNMGELPDLNKHMVAVAIVRKWGKRICVMESDACVS